MFQALSTTHRDVEVELRRDDHGGRHLLEQLVRGLGGEEEGVGPLGVQVPGDVLPDLLLALGNESGGSKARYRLQSATKALLSTTKALKALHYEALHWHLLLDGPLLHGHGGGVGEGVVTDHGDDRHSELHLVRAS